APGHELLVALELFGGLGGFVAIDQTGDDLGRSGRDLSGIDGAGSTIDGEEDSVVVGRAFDGGGPFVVIGLQGSGTADADVTHLTGNESGVGADTTTGGQDTFSGDHAAKIFGRCFDADEEDFFALLGGDDGAVSVEVDLAG